MTEEKNVILSLYPYARGIGFVCLKPPQTLIESGVITIRPISTERILARIKRFVEFYRPTVVLLRQPHKGHSKRAKLVLTLIEAIADFSDSAQLPVHRYTREQMQEAFEISGAKSKYEIALQLLEWFPELSNCAPKLRKPGHDEDYNMCTFDALALAVTHLHHRK